jgi:hypothetical protein
VLFGSVLALFLSFIGFKFFGNTALLLSLCVLSVAIGTFTGFRWAVYPWQVAIVGFIPSLVFLLWRFYTSSDVIDVSLNLSLFVFLPMISIISCYFGAYIGRWTAIGRKKRNVKEEQRKNRP